MRILTRSHLAYTLVLATLIGVGIGTMSALGLEAGWFPGLIAFAAMVVLLQRKSLRRWRTTRAPLPEWKRKWLATHLPLYTSLSQTDRGRFDVDVQIVLNEWRFEGVNGAQPTEARRLSVAAGAALLMHGHPEWELPYRQGVLFYPDHFDDDYDIEAHADFDGMAHQQGPIILSIRALDTAWNRPGDGNVVLHELAHLLDYKTEFADGMPALVDARSADAWADLVDREMDRIERGDSIIRDYGATEPAEFFACAVESFFVEPSRLARHHAELFGALKALFNLDPRAGTTVR
ncbi:MAG: zinc-dependent peptidase [Rhodothermales bacterium]|nr:zinc-dependent peptidase [Rhodothermales bacterium]MBO6778982.1 zinc-dependent peptidase [Rhodothermales bacterium]